MPSTYIRIASVASSATRKSSTSPKSTSIAPPSETTLVKPTSALAAQSRIAPQIAPDCDTRARLPERAGVRAKVAFSPQSVRITPRQFGPSTRTRPRFAAASTRSCSARPSAPVSPKPLVRMTAARTPAAAASSITRSTTRAGVTMTARSGGCGTSGRRA